MSLLRFLLALLAIFNINITPMFTVPEQRTVTMSFVGDCTIATDGGRSGSGTFNWYAKNYEPTYFLEKVAGYFNEDDITVANCETVLSDNNLSRRDKGDGTAYWFIGPASNAKIFSSSGVDVAAFANNHMNDFGSQGQKDTIAALEAEDLTVAKDGVPVYIERNGLTISILACQMWYGGSERSLYSALDEMCANSDYQVIYPHGGAEGTHEVESWRTKSFHNLIDRGADLIVGTHAHRLQPIERYKDATIVYCLGNFCFGGNNHPQNRSAIYQVTITENGDGFDFEDRIIPCYVFTGSSNNWQPAPVPEDDPVYQKIMDFMYGVTDTLG